MEAFKALDTDNRKILIHMSAFVVTHTILSHHSIRPKVVKAVGGAAKFAGLYSLISLATLLPAFYIYYKRTKGTGDTIPFLAKNKDLYVQLGILFAFKAAFMIPLIGTGKLTQPGMTEKQRKEFVKEGKNIRGIIRVLRHPLFCMIGLFSASQLLKGQTWNDLYFNGPMLFQCIMGSLHQDQRLRQWYSPKYFEETSWIPHLAMLTGKQSASDVYNEIGPIRLVVGFILGALSVWYSTKK
eukprot:302164_1